MSKPTGRGGAGRGQGRPKGARTTGHDTRLAIKAEARKRAVEALAITDEAVLQEAAKIGFSNMLDFIRIGEDGLPYCDFSAMTRAQAAAIGEITVETRTEMGTDEAGEKVPVPVRKVKFKLAPKLPALTKLGEYLGLWKQIVEHAGKNGEPIQHEMKVEMSSIELARRFDEIVSEAAKALRKQKKE